MQDALHHARQHRRRDGYDHEHYDGRDTRARYDDRNRQSPTVGGPSWH